jgi:hypothetical protein
MRHFGDILVLDRLGDQADFRLAFSCRRFLSSEAAQNYLFLETEVTKGFLCLDRLRRQTAV